MQRISEYLFWCQLAKAPFFFLCVVVLLREEVAQLQEEVHLLRQMKDMLSKDLDETQGGCSADVLSATELRVQLAQKEQELDRAKEALQGEAQATCSVLSENMDNDTNDMLKSWASFAIVFAFRKPDNEEHVESKVYVGHFTLLDKNVSLLNMQSRLKFH